MPSRPASTAARSPGARPSPWPDPLPAPWPGPCPLDWSGTVSAKARLAIAQARPVRPDICGAGPPLASDPDPDPGAGWKVIDGCIVRTAKSGDLVTVDEFGDFELSVEWKVENATNSGILYRVSLSEAQTYFTGPEYQILDNVHADDRHDPKHLAGALYDLVAPPKDFTHPVGTWNQARIVVRGWHIEHWLNGEKIVEVDLDSPEGRALKAHSKFASMSSFAAYLHGHIALQDEANSVSYRNIKIRELPGSP